MRFLIYEPLRPITDAFTGGRIIETDLLPLEAAAKMASKHAGEEVTPLDFILAAARDEIYLHAYVSRACKMVHCDSGEEREVPKGTIVHLPAQSCKALAVWGETTWRAIERKLMIEDENLIFDWYADNYFVLAEGEEDLVATVERVAVTGGEIHALADAFKDKTSARRIGKLSEEDHELIKLRLEEGLTHKSIAEQFGVARAHISKLAQTWGITSPRSKSASSNKRRPISSKKTSASTWFPSR